MKIVLILLFTALAFTNVICQSDRIDGWSRDIDFLLSKIREQHYVYRNKSLPPEMEKRAAILKERINEYSDERMLIELQGLMYFLRDGHSYILPLGSKVADSQYLPLHLYQFSDGMFVIDADEANNRFIGMKVKTIVGVKPEKLLRDMRTFVSQDNIFGAKWIGPTFLRFRGFLERYELAKNADKAMLRFVDREGKTLDAAVSFVKPSGFRGVPKLVPPRDTSKEKVPMYLSNVADNFWFRYLPDHRAVYFQFNQVRNKEAESLSTFAARLGSELKEKKPRLLIVDVRHNNGGNGDLTPPLIKTLKEFESVDKGRIIIITGRNTFSAAQIFISRVNRETKAIFAGEPSSSKPNFVGEENEVILPYSGAIGSISNRYHENIPGDTRKWIVPKLAIELSSTDYFGNRDRILEAVLAKYSK